MAGVTYYVALPFVASDDGLAAGEPAKCFNPTAVVIPAQASARNEGHIGAVDCPIGNARTRSAPTAASITSPASRQASIGRSSDRASR